MKHKRLGLFRNGVQQGGGWFRDHLIYIIRAECVELIIGHDIIHTYPISYTRLIRPVAAALEEYEAYEL